MLKMLDPLEQQDMQRPVAERLARSDSLLPAAILMSLRGRLNIKTGGCMRWLWCALGLCRIGTHVL